MDIHDKIKALEADLGRVAGQGKYNGSSKNAAMIYQLQRQMACVLEILKKLSIENVETEDENASI